MQEVTGARLPQEPNEVNTPSSTPPALDCLQAALMFRAAGLSVMPIGEQKMPTRKWAEFEKRLRTEDEIRRDFRGKVGIGIICGAVSGNIEVVDIDEPELIAEYFDEIEDHAPGLLQRLVVVETPRGGRHLIYKCEEIEGNQNLARRIVPCEPTARDAVLRDGQWGRIKKLFETRGEGGYIVSAASPGFCHPTGRRYEILDGDYCDLPTIEPDERDLLLALARARDEMPAVELAPVAYPDNNNVMMKGNRPGDDFNARASWDEVLCPFGWKAVKRRGDQVLWRRPGDSPNESHAKTNYKGTDKLRVFTSATIFEEKSYDKFAAYAVLNHNGDFGAAAKELARLGFGEKKLIVVPVEPLPDPTAEYEPEPTSPVVSELMAIVSLMTAEWGLTDESKVTLFAMIGISAGRVTFNASLFTIAKFIRKSEGGLDEIENAARERAFGRRRLDALRDELEAVFFPILRVRSKGGWNSKTGETTSTRYQLDMGVFNRALSASREDPYYPSSPAMARSRAAASVARLYIPETYSDEVKKEKKPPLDEIQLLMADEASLERAWDRLQSRWLDVGYTKLERDIQRKIWLEKLENSQLHGKRAQPIRPKRVKEGGY